MIDKKKFAKGKPTDPNLTIDVNNDEIEKLLEGYSNDSTAENLNELLNKVHVSRMLVPANLNSKKQPVPCVIKNDEGKLFMPIYTSKGQIPAEPKSPVILNIPYLAVNDMALKKEVNADGIVINPFTHNLVFKKELLEKIAQVEKARQEAAKNPQKANQSQQPQTKTIQLTEQQYTLVERRQFEMVFLPGKFFEGKQEFMDRLAKEKEEYIDSLYEESYQQKRMYPYLPEDFAVMVMSISDTLSVARIDMQTRDMDIGSSIRAYLVCDTANDVTRYFSIELGKERNHILAEINPDRTRTSLGEAPVEGAELQAILDIVNNKTEA